MSTQDIAILIAAIVAALGTLGAGIKWIVSAFLAGLDKTTTTHSASMEKITQAVHDSSAAMTKAINESTTAQVAAITSLRLEQREQRVEIRTLIGMAPPPDPEASDDGEPSPLTPIRGVPLTPGYLTVNRKGKP